jgi:hypothetical protein
MLQHNVILISFKYQMDHRYAKQELNTKRPMDWLPAHN